jgi:hypothetical protein
MRPGHYQLFGSAAYLDVSGFSFFFTGDVGSTYTVQYSTNVGVSNWTLLVVTDIPVSPAKVTDPATPALKRFYRVLH